ncbi:MAG TPA: DNA translocase FtsK [Candidatus Hydrogenedens sp.]|nr:DNA translocase FtsK [Candidatus Hydrogenedens sp.]HPP58452.1 DNA translocase FtsK [Candidatus Hydrogenedens sp.]
MFYQKNTFTKKMVCTIVFALISAVIFLTVIQDYSYVIERTKRVTSSENPLISINQPFLQRFVNILRVFFGPAIHAIYIIPFLWLIVLWGSTRSFSIIQSVTGLFILLLGLVSFIQAYFYYQTGSYHSDGAIGVVINDILKYFGLIPSLVVSFMLVLAGIFLSLDWFALWIVFSAVQLVTAIFKFNAFAVCKINDVFKKRSKAKQIDTTTDTSSLQLTLPWQHEETKNREKSLLPEVPILDVSENPSCDVIDFSKTKLSSSDTQEHLQETRVAVNETPSFTENKRLSVSPLQDEKKEVLLPFNTGVPNEPIRPVRPSEPKKEVSPSKAPQKDYPKKYTKPPLSLLDEPIPLQIPDYNDQIQERARKLIDTLERFGVKARVTGITRGPTITRFELEPEPGVRVTLFSSHADDITLSLKADRVRVEAPIPGKGKVGIEVPNLVREQVLLRELLESPAIHKHQGRLKLPLGKDIAGEVKVVDLTQMPHLLIAGATGSGKTVFVKALLASLLFQYTPEELRLVLIDPKMVEFSIFNDIPHLLEPVVTDAKKAGEALEILVKEMERRYNLFANTNTRNLEIYNQNIDKGQLELFKKNQDDLFDNDKEDEEPRKLPHIVCIIDELADLMMLQRAAVESAIARLSQLARAVGIHLIVATQRPSVDVITGVIKANFPARISFQVSSRVDSRCILDTIGAEKLIGHGDMLYHNAGLPKPMRIQGAFVSDEEIESLVNYLKSQAPPQYLNSIGSGNRIRKENDFDMDGEDPLFEEAVRVVRETKQASVSLLQRRLRIGYARAGHLIDLMEQRGIVGPHRGSKPREIIGFSPTDGNEIIDNENYYNEDDDDGNGVLV